VKIKRLLKDIFREVEAFFLVYMMIPEKWRLLFRNIGLLQRFLLFLKTFFIEIEAFSRIARLFKSIYSGMEAFLK
jgi:hypothetical protein